ncbi:UxaA family hydrolase [Haloferula chungangensis]|uniref:UxaA family hydrolase n=1 Tax=Haloferula chungangensis TaxID=1048331 RepID=A0ABW2LCF4_9BACT
MSARFQASPIEGFARFPLPGDNAVIATQDLKKGYALLHGGQEIRVQHDILTGHRFAAREIKKGDAITSWEYPFGRATRDIQPGEYLCNQGVLDRFAIQQDPKYRNLEIPSEPNFIDDMPEYVFDESGWTEPEALEAYATTRGFAGHFRGERGTGTRNLVVVLGTTSRTSALAQRAAERFQGKTAAFTQVDDVVAIRHTEGAETDHEERQRTLRTLAGLVTHPNVGALVAIDTRTESEITNGELLDWIAKHGPDISDLSIHLVTAAETFSRDLDAVCRQIETALTEANRSERSDRPFSELKIGLNCGASDAFSGICGNVLSSAIAREVIYYGGSANLTETPELAGAEDYTLSSITDPAIGPRFLDMLDRFKQQLGWHGGKVDKNPSEGNLLGGLYNITLKSLGAAVKRDPRIPIQHVTEFGERMNFPGFYFMDGMGGDIASYTGQAAAGCNIILFVTGRGTPTNSSIVPTIKIVNTTERYELMKDDIDINAGRYLDGMSMEDLTAESLDRVAAIASGERTNGEKAHQNIDLLWRRKFFMAEPVLPAPSHASRLSGEPLTLQPSASWRRLEISFDGIRENGRVTPRERVGLILPTVGCSVATAEQAAIRLNRSRLLTSERVSRFVVLSNTEGCGVTTGSEIINFMLGYSNHSLVERCLFLSLGCEMVSLNFLRSAMSGQDIGFPEITKAVRNRKIELDYFGWLTIQGARGTANTITAVEEWFHQQLENIPARNFAQGSASDLKLAMMSGDNLSDELARSLGELAQHVIASGGNIIVPDLDPLRDSSIFRLQLGITHWAPTLSFAQDVSTAGMHIMQCITENSVERVTGLGAAADIILHADSRSAALAHVLTPTLNVTDHSESSDFDKKLITSEVESWSQQLADLVSDVASARLIPRQNAIGQTGNQIARGARAVAI